MLHRLVEPAQYTSVKFTEHCELEGISLSVGSVGDAYDNALMECVIGLYKTEAIRRGPFTTGPRRTIADVEYTTMAWVDWYNHRRLHSTLGYIPPAEHEDQHYANNLNPQPEVHPV